MGHSASMSRAGIATALAAAAFLAGCAAPPATGINDPDEAQNREVHAFNRAVDRTLFKPASGAYGGVVPEPVRQGVSNFAGNLDLPGDVVNNVLQGRLGKAAENTLRFAINTTIGIGGLFDPARALGVNGDPTDFGETLHVWGAAEGAYHELPFLGPSTDRDTMGALVDFALNPVRLAFPDDAGAATTAAAVASTLGDRYRFSGTFDSILYDSADSYAQARLLYLQNRRFELGQEAGTDGTGDDFVDPYEDPYAP
jgi:phospholipid-binding lipoprotein MlaA